MINTECGIFGIIGVSEIPSSVCFDGLGDLQHRGRESFGVSWSAASGEILCEKAFGEVFNLKPTTSSLSWLGHVRYSTSGDSDIRKTQPILETTGKWALAHNGNIPSIKWENVIFDNTHSDTQKLVVLIEHLIEEGMSLEKILEKIIVEIDLAFSIALQTRAGMYLLRDKFGLRPLGYIRNDESVTIASENWGIRGDFINVVPGELLFVGNDCSIRTICRIPNNVAHCVFEYIYFLKGSSTVDSINANNFRKSLGKILGEQLIEKTPSLVDNWQNNRAVICGVPTSGVYFGKSISEG